MRCVLALVLTLIVSAGLCADEVVSGKRDLVGQIQPRAAEGDWPWWRGPNRNGVSADRRTVTKWSRTKNVVWTANVPGRGHSSPIVCGDRVFLSTADKSAQTQSLLALDRKTGARLWTTVVHRGKFTAKHRKNSHASATPACDGERVFAVFINNNGLYVTTTDLDGKIVWQKRVGDFRAKHGYGSSPVLYKSTIIVVGDNATSAYLSALDRRTGKIVWRTKRTPVGIYGNYGTPIVGVVGKRMQLLQGGLRRTMSYDPDTGKLLWSCAGPAEVTGNTVTHNGTLVFSSGGFPEKQLRAIRADGTGDVTNSHIAWKTGKSIAYVPSPLYHAGCLYVVSDKGIATCFDANSGKPIWQKRLQGAFSASPVLVGDLIYATNESGTTYLFKASRTYQPIGANALQEKTLSTPAICGGRIYLRTQSKLYCFGPATGK